MRDLDKALADIVAIRSQLAAGTACRGYGPATIAATSGVALVTAILQHFLLTDPTAKPLAFFFGWAAAALLVATLAWAFGSIWSRRQDMPEGPMNGAAQMLCAAPALALTAWLTGERLPAHPPTASILAIAYLAVFGSIIAFSAYLFLIKHARPALTASYAYVNPPVAVLLGAMIAGEHVGTAEIGGMVVILVGVAVITLAHAGIGRRRAAAAE